jgi:DNA polymerase-3 subunit delta'
VTQTTDTEIPAPRATAALIGHAEAEAAMLAATTANRLPHAWLIGGPPGIGKATLAFRFARFLLSGRAAEAGGLFGAPDSLAVERDDPVFQRVASGGHADLLTIERPVVKEDRDKDIPLDQKRRTRDIPVDEVRRIGPFLRLTPAEGGYRIVVVDQAELMNRNAANAILKVLEEPPRRAVLLLVCNNPGRLLPTIRSRCRRIDLDPLPEAAVADWLGRHVPELSEADRFALARLAEGSIGRARALAAEGGLDLYRRLIELIEPLPKLDMVAVHKLGDQIGGAGPAAEAAWRTTTDLLQWWLGRLVRAGAAGTLPAEVVAGEAALMQRLVGDARPGGGGRLDRWIEVWEKTGRGLARADGANLDRKNVLIGVFASIQDAARA